MRPAAASQPSLRNGQACQTPKHLSADTTKTPNTTHNNHLLHLPPLPPPLLFIHHYQHLSQHSSPLIIIIIHRLSTLSHYSSPSSIPLVLIVIHFSTWWSCTYSPQPPQPPIPITLHHHHHQSSPVPCRTFPALSISLSGVSILHPAPEYVIVPSL